MRGVPEINKVIRLLEECILQVQERKNVLLLPLHSNLSPSEQKRVFLPVKKGDVKVVISTNIAEASVTIPDVTVVVDSCRVKELTYDVERQMTSLESKLAAQDSLRQRRGRAGRVKAGRCFKLITENTFKNLPPDSVPEILRVPLESLLLQTLAMELDQHYSVTLSHCLDPPPMDALEAAYSSLQKIRAVNKDTGILTEIGKCLSLFPCAPKIGKLLVLGPLFKCVSSVSTAAAILASKSPYIIDGTPELREAVRNHKIRLIESTLKGYVSDHLTLLEMFKEFDNTKDKRRYCSENGLSYDKMCDILELREEFLETLVDNGFLPTTRAGIDSRASCNAYSNEVPNVLLDIIITTNVAYRLLLSVQSFALVFIHMLHA